MNAHDKRVAEESFEKGMLLVERSPERYRKLYMEAASIGTGDEESADFWFSELMSEQVRIWSTLIELDGTELLRGMLAALADVI